MTNNDQDLDKKLREMAKPNLDDAKKRELHQSIMAFASQGERKKRRGYVMKRFAAGIAGVSAAAILAFFIVTSPDEDPSQIAGDDPQPDENEVGITTEDTERDDVTTEEKDENDDVTDEPVGDSVEPLDKYEVFSNFSLYHPGYLAEARTFYESETTDYVLGYGHHAHAVTMYELFEVKDDEVTIIRSVVDETDFERIESILHLDNWEEAMIEYLLDEAEPVEELFFTYDEATSETEVTADGETYTVYPVEIENELTYYFKEGEGLWVKIYEDEDTVEMYGEEQKTVRIQDEE
ncbi:hypothetical protein LGQ02_06560 [Bacillus shivajii]|uniref:hypothetical protein n=1 Tax=Bacillus shivajii TaxID=1983719 RepID=UPI001CFB9359|nr:hypothetical protein [Bacillus shivajii]UCZ54420.1 hypothetical protein LGQ02_06560 [Bacillus shivajii]